MRVFHENPFLETVKSKVIISLCETVRLSVSISPRNLCNPLKSMKENQFFQVVRIDIRWVLDVIFLSKATQKVKIVKSDLDLDFRYCYERERKHI